MDDLPPGETELPPGEELVPSDGAVAAVSSDGSSEQRNAGASGAGSGEEPMDADEHAWLERLGVHGQRGAAADAIAVGVAGADSMEMSEDVRPAALVEPAVAPSSAILVAAPVASAAAAPPAAADDGLDDDAAVALLERAQAGARGGPGKKQQLKKRQKEKERHKRRVAGKDGDDSSEAGSAAASDREESTAAAGASSAAPIRVEVQYIAPDVAAQLSTAAAEQGDASLADFAAVFSAFHALEAKKTGASSVAALSAAAGEGSGDGSGKAGSAADKGKAADGDDDDDDDFDVDGDHAEGGKDKAHAASGMSRKQRKEVLMASLASLKRSVAHPEVVEAHDVFSPDPSLLAHLKGLRNSVPVPRHWCKKSRYLQRSKVGTDKPPFELPAFIAATGISTLRGSDLDADAERTLKSKQRDRFLPKMGKIEIEYEVLHDAFFVHQAKPRLSGFGDLYYEGRELERAGSVNFSHKRPGVLSKRLKEALGMLPPPPAPGPDGETPPPAAAPTVPVPPPWLVKMQQYGPPPSYPRLRIAGVNAPLPRGASYGLQPGGWGRPPVDEMGRPLYGNVFGSPEDAPPPPPPEEEEGAAAGGADGSGDGASGSSASKAAKGGPVVDKRSLWGEMGAATQGGIPGITRAAGAAIVKPTAGTAAGAGAGAGAAIPAGATVVDGTATPADGAVSVGGVSTLGGLETPGPEALGIRKGRRAGAAGSTVSGLDTPSSFAGPGAGAGAGAGAGGPAPQLYTVLEQKATALTGALLGTTHTYVLPGAGAAGGTAAGGTGAGAGAGASAGAARPAAGRAASSAAAARADGGVEIALAPEELERLQAEGGAAAGAVLADKYAAEVAAAREAAAAAAAAAREEGMAGVFEEEARKRSRRAAGLPADRDGGGAGGGKGSKKARDFKF